MSAGDQKSAEKHTPTQRGEQIRVRMTRLRQSQRLGMFGLSEIVGLASSAVLLVAVVFAYLYFLTPARMRHTRLQSERETLQRRLHNAQVDARGKEDTQATVEEINKSVQEFESNRLVGRSEGRMSLYEELNQLIRRNNLRNTSGPAYSPLESLDANAQKQTAAPTNRSGSAKWQSLYPGIGINLTVEGQYADLRRFVRDIEASKQFIVINAIELVSSNETVGAQTVPGTVPGEAAPQRAALVSLQLDMVAYFRREQTEAIEQQQQPATETR